MKEEEFLEKLKEKMPELVYEDSLLDSKSIEIPIYFLVRDEEVKVDFEGMVEEFNKKLRTIKEILNIEE